LKLNFTKGPLGRIRLGGLLLFLPLIQAADMRIDHVTVCGTDLKTMQAKLNAVGIPTEYGGQHNNHASEMALTSFPDGSYLEQIAIQPNGDPKAIDLHEWSRQMKGNSGPCAWALRPSDISAEVARLKANVRVTNPERAGRNRPDGTRLEWETSNIGTQVRGTFFPFLIHDITARDARMMPSGKPTSTEFIGVSKVVVAVRDLDAAAREYQKVFGLPAPKKRDGAALAANEVYWDGAPVVLASPVNSHSWLTKRLSEFGEGPCAFVLKSAKSPASVRWLDEKILGWRLGLE
jgi:hypothetical protein